MKDIDIEKLSEFIELNREHLQGIRSCVICSADHREVTLIQKKFPGVNITVTGRDQWDIYDRCPGDPDLVLACNVFMYVKEPQRGIENVLRNTKKFLMLDCCVSYRGGSDGELGQDSDSTRYTMLPYMEAKHPDAFDLHAFQDKILSLVPFNVVSHCGVEGYDRAISFISLFKGEK